MQLLSVLALFVTVGIAAWWGMQYVAQDTGLVAPGQEVTDATIETPIEQARDARAILEGSVGGGATLNLSNQGLTKAPSYIFDRTETEVLDLSHNAIGGALQGEVRFLSALRTLDLSHNNFTGVPAEIGQLSSLTTLDLSYNPITGLPNELGNLKNLRTLDLRGTRYAVQDLETIKKGLSANVEILVD